MTTPDLFRAGLDASGSKKWSYPDAGGRREQHEAQRRVERAAAIRARALLNSARDREAA